MEKEKVKGLEKASEENIAQKSDSKIIPLNLVHILGPMFLVGVGWIAGVLAFLVEFFLGCRK